VSKLPVISGKELCKVFEKLNYFIDHQTGSHMILRQESYPHRRLTIPNHKEIAKGTLRSILRESGLTVEELMKFI